ncbi:MAG: hypothetical protein PHD88_05355 [Firmicutes bacterium]|nr:hypothetical protein [Bacillota bacterium]MDD4693807.1 hypothetical protein [Bacillota bacterium]
MRKSCWLFLLFILILAVPIFAQEPNSSWPNYSPPRVEIQGFLDPDTSTLAGSMKIDFTNKCSHTITEISFLLPANFGSEPNPYLSELYRAKGFYQNFDSSYTYVVGVKVNNETFPVSLEPVSEVTQTFSLYSARMVLSIGELLPEQSVQIEMEFLSKVAHKRGDFGLSLSGVFYLNGGFYPQLLDPEEPNRRVATMINSELLLPSTLVVASNADYQSEISLGGIYKKVNLTYETPVFDLALVAGPGLFVKEATFGDIELYTYYLKGHEKEAVFAMQTAVDVLEYYGKHFGPYTKKRFTIVEGSSLDKATSNEGMVILPTSFYRYYNAGGGSFDGLLGAVIGREVANSWFNNTKSSTNTAKSTQSAWLNIALRTYAASSYFTDKGLDQDLSFGERLGFNLVGESYSLNYHENLELAFLEEILHKGLDEPLITEYADLKYPEVWEKRLQTKGYLVIRTLESFAGRDKVFKLLRKVSEEGKKGSYRIVDNDSFKALGSGVFGDLKFEQFWQDFVIEDKVEDLEIHSIYQVEDKEGYEITLNLSPREAVDWPVEVLLEFRDHTTATIFISPKRSSVTFRSEKPLKRATIDPKSLIIDRERLNNSFPRRTSFAIISGLSSASAGYSIDPILEIRPEENTFNAGFSLAYKNRFYNRLGYSLFYSTKASQLISELEYKRNFRNGSVAVSMLFPNQEFTELNLDFVIKQMAAKNIGYTADHNIDRFKGQVGFSYYPKLNDYNLKLTSTYDNSVLTGRKLSTTFDISKNGGKMSVEAESIKPGILAGFIGRRVNAQSSFYNPLERASTTIKDVPEKTGDYAFTVDLSASIPLILDKELVVLGPFIWEDAEGRLALAFGSAWEKGFSPWSETGIYLKAELLLGFNFLTQPFSLRVSMAKDLRGPQDYSSITLSTRFYREVLSK